MKTKDGKDMEEQALHALLARASRPEPPQGAQGRLMARITPQAARPAAAAVIPFQAPKARPWVGLVGLGLPLAASLLLGIFIGNESLLDQYLPESVAALVSDDGLSVDLPLGLDDADSANGDLA